MVVSRACGGVLLTGPLAVVLLVKTGAVSPPPCGVGESAPLPGRGDLRLSFVYLRAKWLAAEPVAQWRQAEASDTGRWGG